MKINNRDLGVTVIGSTGCLHPTTPIYDPITQTTKTILDRYQDSESFHVFSLNGRNEVVIAKAKPPDKYFQAKMYKVTFNNGRNIIVTGKHRFFTGCGYRTVIELLYALDELQPVLLPSISEHDLLRCVSDDHYWKQINGDFQDGCQWLSHLYDQQLQLVKDNGLTFFPLPADVQKQDFALYEMGDKENRDKYNPSQQLCQISKQDSFLLENNIFSNELQCHFLQGKSLPYLPYISSLRQPDAYLNRNYTTLLPSEFSPYSTLFHSAKNQFFSCLLNNEIWDEYQYHFLEDTLLQFHIYHQSDLLPVTYLNQSDKVEWLPESFPASISYLTPSSIYGITGATICQISLIEEVNEEVYYDFEVPIYENYWACGVFNHNTGKTSFLHNLVMDDIVSGTSAIIFDPHGDLVTDVLESIPNNYTQHVKVLSVSETRPFGLNLWQCDNPTSHLAVSRTVDNAILVFKRMMQDERGFHPHIEYLLRNLGYTLVYNPQYTLAEASLLFDQTDIGTHVRAAMLQKITSYDIRNFWQGVEHRRGNLAYQYIEPVLNKISPFVVNEALRLIVAQTKTTIPFSDYLDQEGNILLISLPIGILGEEMTQSLGMMLLSVLGEHIYERVRQRRERRTPLHLYIDELGRFATSGTAIGKLLKEGRKFSVSTTIAFQTFADLPDNEAKSAVLQTGTLVSFQVIGGIDAEILSKQLQVKPPPGDPVPKMRMEPNIVKKYKHIWTDPVAQRIYEEYERNYDSIQAEISRLYREEERAVYGSVKRKEIEKEISRQWEYAGQMAELHREYKVMVSYEAQEGFIPTDKGKEGRSIYDMVEGTPRTFADLWNEMQVTLASLPPYNCYIQTINERKEIVETRLVTSPPPKKQDYGQRQAEEIIRRSIAHFGRPAEHVRAEAEARIAPFLGRHENGTEEKPQAEKPKPKEAISRVKKLP
jgi:hypothetical protein